MLCEFNISQKQSILVVLMLIILTLCVYWPVQNYEFVEYDDPTYVTSNYQIQSGITLKSIKDTFYDFHTGHWHPLTMISHMLDWQLFGDRAGGHHWTNVIIHICNTILLFLLFNELTGAMWRSAFVAALFAIHPLNVESVAWISERKNVLSTFFWILTILFYARYVKLPDWKRYLPVFLCFALGLMSKPMLVTLPFVLLLLDYWPLNRIKIQREGQLEMKTIIWKNSNKIFLLILEKIPLFILSSISIYFTIKASKYVNDITSLESLPLLQRISNAVVSYALYIKKLFWPTHLVICYPIIDIPVWQFSIALLFLVIVTVFVCGYCRKYPYLFVGWFWYLGTLVPVIGLVQVGFQAMADRYAYVPFIGLFLMIVWAAEKILSKDIFLKRLFIFISALVIIFLTLATHNQIKLWSNSVTLFEDTIKKDPNNFVAYALMGQVMFVKGENEKALYYYDKVLKLTPRVYAAYKNKGVVLKKMGKRNEAIKLFEKALKLNKSSEDAYYSLALLYSEDNNFDKCIKYALKAIEVKPDYEDGYNILGVALFKKGRIQESILQFEKTLQINPYHKIAQKNLQIALEKKKKSKNNLTAPL